MRDIIFRGKTRAKGNWYEGSYLFLHVPNRDWTGMPRGPAGDVHFIIDQEDMNEAVDPATVGQYTGLKDKTGRRIFEGDIVRVPSFEQPVMQIAFIEGAFCLADAAGEYAADIHYIHHAGDNQTEIIGNIYDNPELMGGEKR